MYYKKGWLKDMSDNKQDEIVIDVKDVTKTYKLYKNDKARILGTIFKKVPYKKKNAVDHVSFSIKRGESVAIFGKNGAGKSTILKMITSVVFPTEGSIEVKGVVSALLELTSGFDPEFTGRDNIYLKGRLMGLKDSDINELEKEIIDFAELEEYIDQPVRTYSSGMKARLGFAICVNIRPEILIVDEALSVGDTAFKEKCVNKISEILNNKNVTLLFVTHVPNVAQEFCKRGIVMKNGKVIFDGEISEAVQVYTDSYKKTPTQNKNVNKPVKKEVIKQDESKKIEDNNENSPLDGQTTLEEIDKKDIEK